MKENRLKASKKLNLEIKTKDVEIYVPFKYFKYFENLDRKKLRKSF